MIIRERETPEGLLVSLCDDGLIGQTFSNGEVSLEVTESFYGGDHCTTAEAVDALQRAAVANIVGEESVSVAIEAGVVDEDRVLDVGSVPHAQVLNMAHMR